MGIAAYNRGSRAISDYITQQLRDQNEVKARPIMTAHETARFRDAGKRRIAACVARDWPEVMIEERWFHEQTGLEPESFRTEARRVFMNPLEVAL